MTTPAASTVTAISSDLEPGTTPVRRPPGVNALVSSGCPNPSGNRTASSTKAPASHTRNGTTAETAIEAAIAATRRPPVLVGMNA
jgi:hypothetical protein